MSEFESELLLQGDGSIGAITPKSSSAYFQWEIPNFCFSCKNVGEYFLSPVFTTSFFHLAEWRLKLYPKSQEEEDKDWLSLYLYYCSDEKVTANIILSILDDKYRKVQEADLQETVFDSDHSAWGYNKLSHRKTIMDEKNKVLIGDKLKILCEIIFKPDYVVPKLINTVNSSSDKINVSAYKLEAFTDFEKLFEHEHHSDVTIIIGENKIRAHKAIITSRSPVFDAMFKHDMKEKENNTIEITDVSYEVMKEVLRFMYASKVNDIQKMASDLLVAAEKYSVEGLKTLCEETLYENLNKKNSVELLKLADMCNATNLKSQVIEFIVRNQQAIAGKPEFELFGDLHSKVLCELILALIAKSST